MYNYNVTQTLCEPWHTFPEFQGSRLSGKLRKQSQKVTDTSNSVRHKMWDLKELVPNQESSPLKKTFHKGRKFPWFLYVSNS